MKTRNALILGDLFCAPDLKIVRTTLENTRRPVIVLQFVRYARMKNRSSLAPVVLSNWIHYYDSAASLTVVSSRQIPTRPPRVIYYVLRSRPRSDYHIKIHLFKLFSLEKWTTAIHTQFSFYSKQKTVFDNRTSIGKQNNDFEQLNFRHQIFFIYAWLQISYTFHLLLSF